MGLRVEWEDLSNTGGKKSLFFVQFSDRLSGMPTSTRSESSSPGGCFAAPAADLDLPGGQQHCLHCGMPLDAAGYMMGVVP